LDAAIIALLLGVHAWLAFDAAQRLTVTHDEYWHLPVGLLNLTTGRFDQDNLNPPLVRMWAALPLLAGAERPDNEAVERDAREHGDAFMRANRDEYHALFARGRTMIVLLSVLTGVLLAIWARQWFGRQSALLTVLLWAASPTALMSASLVTTDLAAALMFTATLYLLWRFARRPGYGGAAGFGICLGLAQLAKFTCLMLYPLAIVLWFVFRLARAERTESRGKCTQLWLIALSLSLLVVNMGYLFRGSLAPLESYHFGSKTLSHLARTLEPAGSLPVPLPLDYVEGIDRQRQIMESRHPVYLDGTLNTEGFPLYYLYAMWYKLPHTLQLLSVLVFVFVLRPCGEPRFVRFQLALLLPLALLLLAASGSGMQLGIRYILPVLPFLILFAGQSARWVDFSRYQVRSCLVVGVAVFIPLSLRFHPHHLAYFNELSGGPANGHAHLLDSNIDWGQDLRALKSYLDEQGVDRVGLAYFGMLPPSALEIDYFIPRARPLRPGWYAVSMNFAQGRPHTIRQPDGSIEPIGPNEFSHFRFLKPTARIGYSINVYHIPGGTGP
jgi:4-amino-4-deoxy-L-arabinose transferase-like glycosyltransferase